MPRTRFLRVPLARRTANARAIDADCSITLTIHRLTSVDELDSVTMSPSLWVPLSCVVWKSSQFALVLPSGMHSHALKAGRIKMARELLSGFAEMC